MLKVSVSWDFKGRIKTSIALKAGREDTLMVVLSWHPQFESRRDLGFFLWYVHLSSPHLSSSLCCLRHYVHERVDV